MTKSMEKGGMPEVTITPPATTVEGVYDALDTNAKFTALADAQKQLERIARSFPVITFQTREDRINISYFMKELSLGAVPVKDLFTLDDDNQITPLSFDRAFDLITAMLPSMASLDEQIRHYTPVYQAVADDIKQAADAEDWELVRELTYTAKMWSERLQKLRKSRREYYRVSPPCPLPEA